MIIIIHDKSLIWDIYLLSVCFHGELPILYKFQDILNKFELIGHFSGVSGTPKVFRPVETLYQA